MPPNKREKRGDDVTLTFNKTIKKEQFSYGRCNSKKTNELTQQYATREVIKKKHST